MKRIIFILLFLFALNSVISADFDTYTVFNTTDTDNFNVTVFGTTDTDYFTNFDYDSLDTFGITESDSFEFTSTSELTLDFSKHVSYNIRQITNYYGLNYINVNKFILDVNNETGEHFKNLYELLFYFKITDLTVIETPLNIAFGTDGFGLGGF